MRIRSRFLSLLTAILLLSGIATRNSIAQGHLTVHVDRPGIKISPIFYGLMTEEINHSYDGGLYAELIQNRAFADDARTPTHWSLVTGPNATGTMALDSTLPVAGTALAHSLRLEITSVGAGQRVGVANEGYWGIPVQPNTTYRASFYAKSDATFQGPLTLSIENNYGGTVYAHAVVPQMTTQWRQVTVQFKTGRVATSEANRFVLSASHPGTLWFSQVSLFPPTFRHRPNGTRIDLMQKLGGMSPRFLRLPGGNYLEGNRIAERFEWKDTLHTIAQRPGHPGPWGYRSSDGLGLLEFLEWCEDLHMQPVLAVFAGYALGGEHVAAGPELTPYVQDALDEIEYVTGSTRTRWGAVRAKDGHPAPFPLTYVEIGNEDMFDRSRGYDGRYAAFYDAIKAKYPKLQLIATMNVKSRTPDVVDDHYYRSARAMEQDVHHYDTYSRTGPKIFVGEWASTEGSPTPTFQAALGDAAWLTGLERNSDLVVMEAYAPLLVNVNPGAAQWGTNLIGYDALHSFGSPSYYVQAMFGANRGDVVLPVELTVPPAPVVETPLPKGKIGVGTWATQSEYKDIQVTHGDETLYRKSFTEGIADWSTGTGQWKATDGALQQSSEQTDCRATAGDTKWADYTYHLKARKLGGDEGFLILFHVQDDDNWVWWNIGGWGNTRTVLERNRNGSKGEIGRAVPVTVETGRWYDIRIEVNGRNIRCYLDGKLTNEATDQELPDPNPLYATASRELKSGDIILKVVNVAPNAQSMQIELQGAENVEKTATETILTGRLTDVNTLEVPAKVMPQTVRIPGVGQSFLYAFPSHSVTVLRLKASRSK